jgi:phosphatidate cytidylyltransferase
MDSRSMTWKRVATAAVLIPFVVAVVLFASNTVVAIVTAAVTILALWEYFALGNAIGHRAYRFWTLFCAVLVTINWVHPGGVGRILPLPSTDLNEIRFQLIPDPSEPLRVISSLLIFIFGITCLTLWTRRPLVESLPAAGISSSALLLVAFPLSFSVALHALPHNGPKFLLFALVLTWAGDTTAYFVGRGVGKHPLAPHISPKKTWEGSIGSMFGSLLVAYVFSHWIHLPLIHLLIMAVLGNIAGQMGDLLESAYKRSAGVKDSGGLLPGHGGILDRIDALILCIPVIWYYLVLVNPSIR